MSPHPRAPTPIGFAGKVSLSRDPALSALAAGRGDDLSPALWIDGDVLNAQDLRRELRLDEHAEMPAVLRAAWRRWSTETPSHLEGVFTLAVRDEAGLHLYRDPSGLKNLYAYMIGTGEVAFATDLDRLVTFLGASLRPARFALHEYLRFLDITAPNAWHENVRAVEPGKLLQWAAGDSQPCSSNLAQPSPAQSANFDRAVDRLDELLHRGVRACLADSARPAAFLSGGIDSALLCAVAARHRPELTAITVGFDAIPFDEAPIAQCIASHLGLQHHVLRFSRAEYVGAFERLTAGMDQPMADPATPATLLSFDHCIRQFDVVLDGTGVEDAIGYMPPRHMRVAAEYAVLLPRAVRVQLVHLLARVPALAGYTPIVDFDHPAETMIRWKGFRRHEIEALCREPVSLDQTQFYRTYSQFGRREHLERYSAVMACLPNERLTQAARLTGAVIRYPFCDSATASFLRQLPADYRHVVGQPKRILRSLLARYVPRSLWDFPKHTFDFPLLSFLAGDNFDLVRRHVLNGRWLERGLLDARIVRRYAHQFMAGEQHLMFRVWALVTLGAWLDAHEWVN